MCDIFRTTKCGCCGPGNRQCRQRTGGRELKSEEELRGRIGKIKRNAGFVCWGVEYTKPGCKKSLPVFEYKGTSLKVPSVWISPTAYMKSHRGTISAGCIPSNQI